MQVSITARHFDLSEGLREHTHEKLGRLARYGLPLMKAHAVLLVEKHRHKAEVTLHGNGFNLSGVSESDDMYSSVDQVAQKLESQVRRQKEKMHNRKQKGERREGAARVDVVRSESVGKGAANVEVIQTSEVNPPSMSVEEAILVFEQSSDDFLLFTNPISDKVNILLRRSDGNYGVVEI